MKIGTFDTEKNGVFIIAELSANHGGSLEIALKTIRTAAEAGAHAVKLQTFTPDTITLNSFKDDFIIKGGTLWDGKRLYDLYEWAHTPWEWHEALFAEARNAGIQCFSSPFDNTAIDFLEQFDPPAYKIASFEITDHQLIRYAAAKGRPIIISTGIATKEEISDALTICKEEGNHQIALLQCTSAYPASPKDANLRTIPNMKETFGVEVGLSDHTLGIAAPVVAIALGAKIIEKHFMLDTSVGGPDVDFSLDQNEFASMVTAVNDAQNMLGVVDYSTKSKSPNRHFSRSLYASKAIKKGEPFSQSNVKSVRPGYGLHPKHFKTILGKPSNKDYELGDRITF